MKSLLYTAARLSMLLLSAVLAGSLLSGCQTEVPEVFPGRRLRTEILSEEASPFLLLVRLTPTDATPFAWRVERWAEVEVHERPVYRKMNVYSDPDDLIGHHTRYEPVPGEEIEGAAEVRTEKRRIGLLAEARVRCLGVAHKTGSGGILRLDPEQVLRPFDDPRRDGLEIRVSHEKAGSVREIISRAEALRALGVEMTPGPARVSDAAGLRLALRSSADLVSGEPVSLVVEARNAGSRPVYALRGRVFSRHDWLDGLLFHLGDLAPGEQRQFRRRAVLPAGAGTIASPVFAQIGFRHAEGPLPDLALKLVLANRSTSRPGCAFFAFLIVIP